MFFKKNKHKRVQDKEKINFQKEIKKFIQNKSYKNLLIFICSIFIITYIIFYKPDIINIDLKEGNPSKLDVFSIINFHYLDDDLNKERKKDALDNIDYVYDIDIDKTNDILQYSSQFFKYISKENLNKKEKKFIENLDISKRYKDVLTQAILKNLNTEKTITNIMKFILNQGIVGYYEKYSLGKTGREYIVIRNLLEEKEKKILIDDLITNKNVYEIVRSKIKNSFKKNLRLRYAVEELINTFLQVNLYNNQEEYQLRKELIEKDIKPEYKSFKRGDIILRKGERITKKHLNIIDTMNLKSHGLASRINRFISLSLVILMSVLILVEYIRRFQSKIIKNEKSLTIIAFIFILMIFLMKLFQIYNIEIYYAAVIIGAMLLTILIDSMISMVGVLVLTIYTMSFTQDVSVIGCALIGGFISICTVNRVAKRTDILKGGLLVGLAGFTITMAYGLGMDFIYFSAVFNSSIVSLIVLFISSLVVIGLLPVFEYLFRITTDIRLLELSDIKHPLLKMLADKASGTYHHSLVVSRLSEAAAEVVGAKVLLARVGAYYHDIGKINKPDYFIENQQQSEKRKHDKLSANMSSLIIIAHIKDGCELAKKYKLGDDISNILIEHHGTSLIYFFYKKAQKDSKDSENISEEKFRYPGPKPQSKEAAIIMLADSVEAASRALSEPTPSRVKGLIRRVINDKFIDGQLDECDLTLQDISRIEVSFSKVLNGVFHIRVEYPPDEKKAANG